MPQRSRIYLDHAATTPARAEVVEAMLPFFTEQYGNPASLHRLGVEAQKALNEAQVSIACAVGIQNLEDIIFTSGATEANNLALKGLAYGLQDKGKHIITSQVEHPSVLEPCAWLESQGWKITYLSADTQGWVNPIELEAAIRKDTVIVSVMHGNNEVGTIQSIDALGKIAKEHGVLFHTDAVQTVGKLPLDMSRLPVDMMSCSGHKLYGPKGVGFLYANKSARMSLMPLLHGGGQQLGLRPGTENVPAIVGLAKALELATKEQTEIVTRLHQLQEQLTSRILEEIPGPELNGPRDLFRRVPGNVHFSFPQIEGEALVLKMDMAGISVSSGSACHSGKLTGSHVLRAMGRNKASARGAIRFSMGRNTTPEEVDKVVEGLKKSLNPLNTLTDVH